MSRASRQCLRCQAALEGAGLADQPGRLTLRALQVGDARRPSWMSGAALELMRKLIDADSAMLARLRPSEAQRSDFAGLPGSLHPAAQ